MRKCGYSQINLNKIRTSPQPGPRIAWIGNPLQQNCMVEAGTWSLRLKIHPEKKPQKKKNKTVIEMVFEPKTIPEKFSASGFFL
jgi:hypothetical protein